MHTSTADQAALRRVLIAPMTSVEVRDATGNHDGAWSMSGYAAVFNQETTLYDGAYHRMREMIAPGAFARVLTEDPTVHLNFGHDMQTAIASTRVRRDGGGALPVGGLELAEDEHGLRFFARVSATDPDAIRLAEKMRIGVVNQASFAFTIRREDSLATTTEDGREDSLFTIREVGDLYDVCACAQGAYPQTEAHIRSLYRATFGAPFEISPPRREVDSISPQRGGGADDVTSGVVVPTAPTSAAQLAKLRARARSARHLHPHKEG